MLSSSSPQSARRCNTGLLPTLYSMPERCKNQPNLAIFSPLSPEMTLLTGSGEIFQVWRSCACTSCFKADQSVKKDADSGQAADTSGGSPPSPLPPLHSPTPTHHPFLLWLLMVALLPRPAQGCAQGGGLSQPLGSKHAKSSCLADQHSS